MKNGCGPFRRWNHREFLRIGAASLCVEDAPIIREALA